MKYIPFIFIVLTFFAISCGSDNTVKPKWEGCITETNCEDGQKCIAGNCVESTECESDSTCLNGQFCNKDNLCESYCNSDDDCGAGFICNSESKKCEKDPNVKTCETDSECKENEICKDYECIPDNNPVTCESDANCLNGQHCSNGTCITDCDETSCETGYTCNAESKECELSKCEKDADCEAGFYCKDEVCVTKEYECTDNSQCFNGYICKENKCIMDVECLSPNDCNGDLTIKCMGAHWECQENKCVQECGEEPECFTADDCDGPISIECMGAHWECKNNECIEACGEDKCGNNICDTEIGEDYINCPSDCRDDHCDDGTVPMCDMLPPNCAPGELLAYYNNCYACVNPATCKPVPERCQSNEECGEGFICTEDGTCKAIQFDCREDADCPELPLPINCEGHWECQENQCIPVCNDFYCGDGVCNEGENYDNCSEDCGVNECETDRDCDDGNLCTVNACSNGMCVSMGIRCPQGLECNPDTGECEDGRPVCGNGECELGEWDTCPADCQQTECREDPDCFIYGENYICVEGYCKYNEEPVCGNGECELGEWDTCPIDCQEPECRNDFDCINYGDNYICIEGYCRPGEQPFCGDGVCDGPENAQTCPADCGITIECEPDQFEPNNDISNPARVTNGTYDGLTITYDNEDWYSFDYDGQTVLQINFNFINTNGDIDIYAFQDGQEITSSEGYTNTETLVIDPDRFRAGEVLIKAALIRNPNEPYHECQTYSVETNYNSNICVPDQFEPNNRKRDAVFLGLENNSGNYNLTICDTDTDWFTLRMNTYTQLVVATDLNFKTELYLLGNQAPIATSELTSDGLERLTYTNMNQDERSINVLLKVFKDDTTINDNTSYDYNLDINIYDIDFGK